MQAYKLFDKLVFSFTLPTLQPVSPKGIQAAWGLDCNTLGREDDQSVGAQTVLLSTSPLQYCPYPAVQILQLCSVGSCSLCQHCYCTVHCTVQCTVQGHCFICTFSTRSQRYKLLNKFIQKKFLKIMPFMTYDQVLVRNGLGRTKC